MSAETKVQAYPEAQLVPLHAIKPSPRNPRRRCDPRALEDLTASVRQQGVLEPILLRPAGKGYEIVAGERRFLAATAAGLASVPAIVRALDDAQAGEIALIENIQREDLPPLIEAEAYAALVKRHGYSQADIAAKTGKSPAYVSQRLALLALPKAAREALDAGRLPLRVALLLTRVPATLQAEAAERVLGRGDGDPVGFREAARIVLGYSARLGAAAFDLEDAELVPEAGPCSACPKVSAHEAHRDLFGSVPALREAACLDSACFRAKQEAHWRRAQAQARDRGQDVIPDDEARRLFMGQTLSSDQYADLDGVCPVDPKRRTWRQLVRSADKLPRAIARDEHGRVHELTPRPVAVEALRSRGYAFAQPAPSPKASPSGDRRRAEERARERQERQRREVLRATANAAAEAVVAAVEKKDHGAAFWRFVVAGLAAGSWHEAIAATVKRRGWADKKGEHPTAALERQLAKLSVAQLRGLVVDLLLGRHSISAYSTASPFSSVLRQGCKTFGVDLARLHKACAARAKAKAA
jgi:ParB/RepB/Spo0J family partition protein